MIYFGNIKLMNLLQVCNEVAALQTYLNISARALDKRAPRNKNNVKAKNCPLISKKTPKAKMDCTRARNKILKN